MKPVRMVLLGPPAAGKGTQGQLMRSRWGVPVTSVGEMLRQEVAADTATGREAAGFLDAGKLVPDRVAMGCVEGWLEGHLDAFVFDGFPRSAGQGRALDEVLGLRHAPLTDVVWLEIPRHVIEERVSRRLVCPACGQTFALGWHVADRSAACPECGAPLNTRRDDDPRTLSRRLVEYREHTEPLLAEYEVRGILRRIDANRPAEAVFEGIESAVGIAREERAA